MRDFPFEDFLKNLSTNDNPFDELIIEGISEALDYPILDFGTLETLPRPSDRREFQFPYPSFICHFSLDEGLCTRTEYDVIFHLHRAYYEISCIARDQVPGSRAESLCGRYHIDTDTGIGREIMLHWPPLKEGESVSPMEDYIARIIKPSVELVMQAMTAPASAEKTEARTCRKCTYGGGHAPMLTIKEMAPFGAKSGRSKATHVGTGIRKREHLVRGHYRTYKSGKTTFVKAHRRGSKELGRVMVKRKVMPASL